MSANLEMYIPDEVGDEFIYFVKQSDGTFILYDRPYIGQDTTYNYWILYKSLGEDYKEKLQGHTNHWQTIEARQFHQQKTIFARRDIGTYFVAVICIFLIIKFCLNVLTSIVQKRRTSKWVLIKIINY